jgi:hypothetical protein
METLFVIFALGVVVSLVIAKGVMQANDYAKEEMERQRPGVPGDNVHK